MVFKVLLMAHHSWWQRDVILFLVFCSFLDFHGVFWTFMGVKIAILLEQSVNKMGQFFTDRKGKWGLLGKDVV